MIALAFLAFWAGYGHSSWGWCLVRGYDITWRQWFSPVHPYQWPADGNPPTVPKGAVFPGQKPTPAAPTSSPTTGPNTRPPLKGGKCPPNYSRGPDGKCYHIVSPVQEG